MSLIETDITQLRLNPMTLIGKDWWLVTAGQAGNFNTMTASWGHLGAIWSRPGQGSMPTAVIYVRPQRYTKEFLDREPLFSLSVLGEEQRAALNYLGSHSGRDGDKVKAAGLTAVAAEGTVYFAEAKLVLICRKLYHAPLVEAGFIDRDIIARNYPERDYHEQYVGEIVRVLRRAEE
ncbi:MAG: flavin reductase [Bacillota bacterium]|nr:flavin reductase [Bacillota bacterium]